MDGDRRMAGEVGEHGAALLDAVVGIGLVEHALRSRLVQARIEDELRAVLGIAGGGDDRPPREHVGETGDVVLGVAAAHAERMQLQDLAREVLVEPTGAIDAGD